MQHYTGSMKLLKLVVEYTPLESSFLIELEESSIDCIRRLIANHFRVDMNDFLLEIFDERFDRYIILDTYYLTQLQSNPVLRKKNNCRARIRSRDEKINHNLRTTGNITPTVSVDSKCDIDFL